MRSRGVTLVVRLVIPIYLRYHSILTNCLRVTIQSVLKVVFFWCKLIKIPSRVVLGVRMYLVSAARVQG